MDNQLSLTLPEEDSNLGASKLTLTMYCEKQGIRVEDFCNMAIAAALGIQSDAEDAKYWETPIRRAGIPPVKIDKPLLGLVDFFKKAGET
ncbi:hypothetical protein LIN78_16125 [Leeia sp. TBRC 13508]|uniref:Uncharacterized protein n=1 Tax=Leeia speluncae TaxID=2884804 RepID=A0ABS8DA39_9NEIS|nr:hypothetical protein [Leeia speluncae]MCB6185075.1 hypothetical protein [Leeia speluncae]